MEKFNLIKCKMIRWGLILLVIVFYTFAVISIARIESKRVHRIDTFTIKALRQLQIDDSIQIANLQKVTDNQYRVIRRLENMSTKIDTISKNTTKKKKWLQ